MTSRFVVVYANKVEIYTLSKEEIKLSLNKNVSFSP